MPKWKRKKKVDRDISIAVDIILKSLESVEEIISRLDRIEGILAIMQEPEQAIIVNINSKRQGQ